MKTEIENVQRKAGKKEGRNKKRAMFGCVLSLHIFVAQYFNSASKSGTIKIYESIQGRIKGRFARA